MLPLSLMMQLIPCGAVDEGNTDNNKGNLPIRSSAIVHGKSFALLNKKHPPSHSCLHSTILISGKVNLFDYHATAIMAAENGVEEQQQKQQVLSLMKNLLKLMLILQLRLYDLRRCKSLLMLFCFLLFFA